MGYTVMRDKLTGEIIGIWGDPPKDAPETFPLDEAEVRRLTRLSTETLAEQSKLYGGFAAMMEKIK